MIIFLSTKILMSGVYEMLISYMYFFQNAVSMYCRLGFAHKKGQVINLDQLHSSWRNVPSINRLK